MRGERIDDLREQALAAAEGLSVGEHALVDVLREIEREKERAANGYLRGLVEDTLARLDAPALRLGMPLDRLAAVAASLGETLDCTTWTILHAPREGRTLHTVRVVEGRGQTGLHFDAEGPRDFHTTAAHARLLVAEAIRGAAWDPPASARVLRLA